MTQVTPKPGSVNSRYELHFFCHTSQPKDNHEHHLLPLREIQALEHGQR